MLGPTFQRMEQLSGGDVKDVDDSIDGSASQIFSVWALRGKTELNPMMLLTVKKTAKCKDLRLDEL